MFTLEFETLLSLQITCLTFALSAESMTSFSAVPSSTIAYTPELRLFSVELSSGMGTFPSMFSFWSSIHAPLVPIRSSSSDLNFFFSSALTAVPLFILGNGCLSGLVFFLIVLP